MTAKIVHFPCHLRGESATAKAYREASMKKTHVERSAGIARARQIDIDSRPQAPWLKQHHLDQAIMGPIAAIITAIVDPEMGYHREPARFSRWAERWLDELTMRLGPAFHEPETNEMRAAAEGFDLWRPQWLAMLEGARFLLPNGRTAHRQNGLARMKLAPTVLRELLDLLTPCVLTSNQQLITLRRMVGAAGPAIPQRAQ